MSGQQGSGVRASSSPQAPEFYSVREFCQAHSLSRSFFYRLCRQGKGPKVVKLGARTLIPADEARAWRAALATKGSDQGRKRGLRL